jgi:hypothetical protein
MREDKTGPGSETTDTRHERKNILKKSLILPVLFICAINNRLCEQKGVKKYYFFLSNCISSCFFFDVGFFYGLLGRRTIIIWKFFITQ